MTLEQTLIQVAIFFLAAFLVEYFKSKGKNRATKEDIGDLTKIVEQIKTELTEKTEQLKAQLSFVNTHKLNLKNAERDALFDYNRKITAWLYAITRFSLAGYDYENFDGLNDIRKEFRRLQYDTDIAEAPLFLFMRDTPFIELKKDLTIAIINYENFVEQVIIKAKHQYRSTQLKLANAKQEDQMLMLKEHLENINQLNQSLNHEGVPLYSKAANFHSKIVSRISKRLREIEEEQN